MADRSLEGSIRDVLRRLRVQEVKRLSDAELLARYVATQDEAAFTALVSRHGPTVLGVCRRVLRDADVDDVFQATFLSLAKEARTIRQQEAVGPWLYEVAYHAALRVRARRVRSQQAEQAAAHVEATAADDSVAYRDLQAVLDEELHRLPDKLRRAMVLVHLMGHVQVDAASELGITDRALRKRLQAGREQLRQGLTRRGVSLTAAALATVLVRQAAAGPVPPNLFAPTVQSVLAYAAGQTGAVSASAVSLAMAGVGGELATRFKLISLVAGIPTLAALVFTTYALTSTPSVPAPPNSPPAPPASLVEAPDRGKEVLTGQVLDAAGQTVPHAAVTALVRRPWQPNDRGLQDQEVARTTADDAGRYRLVVPNDFPTIYPERQVTLLAHAAGLAPITTTIVLHGRPGPANLRLPQGTVAEGRLLDPDGQAAAGVRLAVVRLGRMTREIDQGAEPTPAPPGWPADTITDNDGRFRMEGMSRDDAPWLQVQDDRFALSTFALPVGAANPLTVTLAEPRVLVARVVAARTDQPLAFARISVCAGALPTRSGRYTALASSPDAAASAPASELTGRTDAEGRIRLRLPPGDTHDVHVYPADGVAYVERPWKLEWTNGELSQERTFTLVAGAEVRGEVVEEDGRPIAGACVYFAVPFPRSSTAPIGGGDTVPFGAMVRFTGADGRFHIVVPPYQCHLEVMGPTADYRPQTFEYEPCHYCDDGHTARILEHAFVAMHYTRHDRPELIRLTLRRGTPVTGRATGPSGEDIPNGVLVSRSAAQPLRSVVPRVLSIRDGIFELPGCVPERTYPVLFLDPARRLGAVAELHLPDSGESPPTIRLEACGTAKVRLVDAVGRPLAGQPALVRALLDYDRPSVEPAAPPTRAKSAIVATSWIDTLNYPSAPTTDAEGIAVLPALVPGLKYYVEFVIDGQRVSRTSPFPVAPGETVRLPDVVIDADVNAGHAGGVP